MQGGSKPEDIRKLEKNDEETAEYHCSFTRVGIAVRVCWFVAMILDATSLALLRRQESCCLVCLCHVAKTDTRWFLSESLATLRIQIRVCVSRLSEAFATQRRVVKRHRAIVEYMRATSGAARQ